jgi:hypothetical protein
MTITGFVSSDLSIPFSININSEKNCEVKYMYCQWIISNSLYFSCHLPEQTYDINVKAIAGYKRTDPDSQHIFSMSDSPMSNTLPVSAPAAPKSPKLMLEGLHPEGIDVSWQVPQQFGDAAISVSLFYRISFVFIENVIYKSRVEIPRTGFTPTTFLCLFQSMS